MHITMIRTTHINVDTPTRVPVPRCYVEIPECHLHSPSDGRLQAGVKRNVISNHSWRCFLLKSKRFRTQTPATQSSLWAELYTLSLEWSFLISLKALSLSTLIGKSSNVRIHGIGCFGSCQDRIRACVYQGRSGFERSSMPLKTTANPTVSSCIKSRYGHFTCVRLYFKAKSALHCYRRGYSSAHGVIRDVFSLHTQQTHIQEACIWVPVNSGYPGLFTARQYFPAFMSNTFFPAETQSTEVDETEKLKSNRKSRRLSALFTRNQSRQTLSDPAGFTAQ